VNRISLAVATRDQPDDLRRMIPRRQTVWLVLIGIAALFIRLAPLARGDLKFQSAWDAADYIPLAQGIQHGCGFAKFDNGHCASAEILRPPGYPFFVAMMPGLRTVLVIQAFLGAALCIWLGWFVSARWGIGAGLTAAAILATDIPSIVYGAMIMSEALFQFLLTGAILLQLSAIIADELNAVTAAKVFAAAGLLAAAAMIRPTGIFLPLFAPLPFLLMKGATWPRALVLAVLAFAIPIAAMLPWMARNQRVAGVNAMSTDSAVTIFDYNAAGVLAYATHRSFGEASTELAHEIGWQGDPSAIPFTLSQAMIRQSFKTFAEHPFATLVVTVRGLVLVAIVPDRNELNELLGTNGGGPLGLAPSFDITTRIRRTMNSPVLAILVLVQLMLNLLVWAGVARGLFRTDWNSKIEAACILIPLGVAFAMLACAASPAAHARFRVPAVPFLAMLAGIGWLGRRADEVSSSETDVRDSAMAVRPVVSQMRG
jgi:hypothetical protein